MVYIILLLLLAISLLDRIFGSVWILNNRTLLNYTEARLLSHFKSKDELDCRPQNIN